MPDKACMKLIQEGRLSGKDQRKSQCEDALSPLLRTVLNVHKVPYATGGRA